MAKVKPAVISVRVKIERGADTTDMGQNIQPFQPGLPLEKFFRQFGSPDMPNGSPQRRQWSRGKAPASSSSDGYAVTNYHVVTMPKSVQVTADGGKIYTAKVIGTDQKTDLALIKVDGKRLPYVKFADQRRGSATGSSRSAIPLASVAP